jgi:hypothetical protein
VDTQYKRIGIDTSKAVFTLRGIDVATRLVLRFRAYDRLPQEAGARRDCQAEGRRGNPPACCAGTVWWGLPPGDVSSFPREAGTQDGDA